MANEGFAQNGGEVDAATMKEYEMYAVIGDSIAGAAMKFESWFSQFPQPLRDIVILETIVLLLSAAALGR